MTSIKSSVVLFKKLLAKKSFWCFLIFFYRDITNNITVKNYSLPLMLSIGKYAYLSIDHNVNSFINMITDFSHPMIAFLMILYDFNDNLPSCLPAYSYIWTMTPYVLRLYHQRKSPSLIKATTVLTTSKELFTNHSSVRQII